MYFPAFYVKLGTKIRYFNENLFSIHGCNIFIGLFSTNDAGY